MNEEKKKQDELVFGIRAVMEAIRSDREIERILLKKGPGSDSFKELFELIRTHKVPFQFVPPEKLNRVTRKNHQGVVAFVSPITYYDVENYLPQLFEAGKDPLILVLDGITDVRNFGAIVRTAECAGVDAVLIAEKGSARVNADAVKTSAGALHLVPVCRAGNLNKAALFLKESGLKLVAASEKSQEDYTCTDYTGPLAIIMGSEDTGIAPELLALADEQVRIPVAGQVQSLNVSVAAGLLAYEAVRQRKR